MKTSSRLWIIEGPDGAGKSTLVNALSGAVHAPVTHLGPFRDVNDGLERFYAEAMLPAVLGHSDIILDRSWLSEKPYGVVFRKGVDRLGIAAVRQLERLALRCNTVVIRALPPKGVVVDNFVRRKRKSSEAEMLEHVHQIESVYNLYAHAFRTALPTTDYDYTAITADEMINAVTDVSGHSSRPHPLEWASAGNLAADIALVGDAFAEHKNRDVLYRWPFSTFGGGPAKWLALRLERAGIPESSIFWVNADKLTPAITAWLAVSGKKVAALGSTAKSVLESSYIPAFYTGHPNGSPRFKMTDPEDYELIPWLQENVL